MGSSPQVEQAEITAVLALLGLIAFVAPTLAVYLVTRLSAATKEIKDAANKVAVATDGGFAKIVAANNENANKIQQVAQTIQETHKNIVARLEEASSERDSIKQQVSSVAQQEKGT